MLELLHYFSEFFGGFNLFRYVTFRALGAATTSLLFCLFFGPWIIQKLTELKLGQPIRTKEEVHRLAELHGSKSGTPTMGGVMILLAFTISCLLWAPLNNFFVCLLPVYEASFFIDFLCLFPFFLSVPPIWTIKIFCPWGGG